MCDLVESEMALEQLEKAVDPKWVILSRGVVNDEFTVLGEGGDGSLWGCNTFRYGVPF